MAQFGTTSARCAAARVEVCVNSSDRRSDQRTDVSIQENDDVLLQRVLWIREVNGRVWELRAKGCKIESRELTAERLMVALVSEVALERIARADFQEPSRVATRHHPGEIERHN